MVVRHHSLLESIFINRGFLFTSNFWLSLFHFICIKRKLSIAFYPQTNGLPERQNSYFEAYFQAFVNFEQYNRAKLLLMTKMVYNNAKNRSTNNTLLELDYGYHLWILYKDNVDSYFKLKPEDKLSAEVRKLMILCCKNPYHPQKLEKQAYNKAIKPKCYVSGNKV